MGTHGTHFSQLGGRRDWGDTLPSNPETGQEYFVSTTDMHCIWDGTRWWCAPFQTTTSTSTTSTSSSTTTTSTSTSTTTTTSTSTSSSTTTTV